MQPVQRSWLYLVSTLMLTITLAPAAAAGIVSLCPAAGIQQRGASFTPGGIILTAFDGASIWVYNIDGNRRYPLPDTNPCGTNCRLSPDARWISYVDAISNTYSKMRLDGTQRTRLIDYAADVLWWTADTLLVWTPAKEAYLQREGDSNREYLDVQGVVEVQPGGRWGLMVEQAGDDFRRALVNLETRDMQGVAGGYIDLGLDTPYYDAASWSPNGQWLAFSAPGVFDTVTNAQGSEIFAVQPDGVIEQWTDLFSTYGATRINGRTNTDLSWSPDSRYIAFWSIELTGPSPEGDTGLATLHVLDTSSRELRSYCGYTTTNHTPNPPRIIWSPDSTHVAFGGDVPRDEKSYLLLALDINSGLFTELSNGIYPTFGGADPVAWGYAP